MKVVAPPVSGPIFILTDKSVLLLGAGPVLSFVGLGFVLVGLALGLQAGAPDKLTAAITGTGVVLIGLGQIPTIRTLVQAFHARRDAYREGRYPRDSLFHPPP